MGINRMEREYKCKCGFIAIFYTDSKFPRSMKCFICGKTLFNTDQTNTDEKEEMINEEEDLQIEIAEAV
jgi:hypothetical protein